MKDRRLARILEMLDSRSPSLEILRRVFTRREDLVMPKEKKMRPIYVLVGGIAKAGKSLFSTRLANEYSFSRIPGDVLVMAFQESFPQLGIGHDPPVGMKPDEHYRSVCRAMGPFLASFMNRLQWEGSKLSYVLDSFHVWPSGLQEIDQQKTRVLFFGYPNADPVEKAKRTKEYALAEYGGLYGSLATADLQSASDAFSRLIVLSGELRTACKEHGFTFVDTSRDFDQAISRAVGIVTDTVNHDKTA
jgi:hypothetical protein